MRIYVDSPHYFIRPNNTDWKYTNALRRSDVGIEFVDDTSLCGISASSSVYALRRLGLGHWAERLSERREIGSRTLAERGIDVVYTHAPPPIVDTARCPLVWFYAVIDPVMQRCYGVSDAQIESQFVFFRKMLSRVTLVQVATRLELERHAAIFPEAASKFVNVPFLLPYICAEPLDAIAAKHRRRDEIRVLFVGNEARRKGLDIVASAMRLLPAAIRSRIELTVISRQANPSWFEGLAANIYSGLPRDRVLEHMRRSHILVMPSRQESFGFVFIEAMAAGCVVVAPHWEAQREITDQGRAGVCVAPEATEVATALACLIEDDRQRLELALAGRERYETCYAAKVVARQHKEMFELALAMNARRDLRAERA